jgi:hypothetical protein
MNQLKMFFAISVVILGLGIYIGRVAFPRVETKEVEKEVIKRDVVTVTKEVIKPDGTKETITTSTDKSQSVADKSISIAKAAPQWHFSGGVSRASLVSENVYSLTVERRILGPVYLGITANTEKTIGILIGAEF